ncbi:unnamed protein product [Spodoptera littoralis]|uniref:Uncharacterized protein n=1 Tax=Spodoptera littoralis TaxID=7109 RepID=A0A9P0I6E6_SPOLI|nr:unnamed protein product [Spodoptera littoralis]CAH1642321.1 unnamed protein product [Spodoptera littoralis]
MIMERCVCFFLLSLVSQSFASVIIPEELPSLLSVAYSNIPPIKKGTDSRVGFGFAFGNHADFQVMFELGPQTNTQALTLAKDTPGVGDRGTISGYRKRGPEDGEHGWLPYHSDASKYLQNWAQKMKYPQKQTQNVQKPGDVPNLEDSMVELIKNEKGEYEIHQPKPGNLPQNILEDLKKLYKLKSEAAKKMGGTKRSEEEVKKITEDLSNVDLD